MRTFVYYITEVRRGAYTIDLTKKPKKKDRLIQPAFAGQGACYAVKVRGYQVDEFFAVDARTSQVGSWYVTHLPSGCHIGKVHLTQANALRDARKIRKCASDRFWRTEWFTKPGSPAFKRVGRKVRDAVGQS